MASNNNLLKFNKNADFDGFVADLSAKMEVKVDMYQMKVMLKPGNSLFEASIRHNLNTDSMQLKLSDISRINMYGRQARCIENDLPQLRKVTNLLNLLNRQLCEQLSIANVQWVTKMAPNNNLLKFNKNADFDGFVADLSAKMEVKVDMYQMKVMLKPGNSLFEASIRHNLNTDSMQLKLSDISRINMYGRQARCIENDLPQLRKVTNLLNLLNRQLCKQLSIANVQWVTKMAPNNNLLKFNKNADFDGFVADLSAKMEVKVDMYQMKVMLKPGNSLFEASIRHNLNTDSMQLKLSDISRINMYGRQARCIENDLPQLRKYCYCRDEL
ncbi:unnamed protein product [Callosobruchus maculatus]|uniref:Uncharacterized protein n=1 Tax=Callosobruchus maculatus TaxID=64391 RepID=A0A653DVV5_CALMS|nr:unnamed protein product [Callosobruchus maculatus]